MKSRVGKLAANEQLGAGEADDYVGGQEIGWCLRRFRNFVRDFVSRGVLMRAYELMFIGK